MGRSPPVSAISALALLSASSFAGGAFIVDLTHPIPTFQPMEGDPMKPDMSKPWLDSTAIPSFGQQTVPSIGQFPTNQGHFDLGTMPAFRRRPSAIAAVQRTSGTGSRSIGTRRAAAPRAFSTASERTATARRRGSGCPSPFAPSSTPAARREAL